MLNCPVFVFISRRTIALKSLEPCGKQTQIQFNVLTVLKYIASKTVFIFICYKWFTWILLAITTVHYNNFPQPTYFRSIIKFITYFYNSILICVKQKIKIMNKVWTTFISLL